MNDDKIFAAPEKVEDVADCYFYHTMELPGYGVINGDWDLRRGVDDYLGNVMFAAKRVLEIGPASGFLTFDMEKRGAEVVSVEVTAEHGWDFVPYPAKRLEEVFGPRRTVMRHLKNSYWFSHAAHRWGQCCYTAAIRFASLSNAGKSPGRLSLWTCFTRTWKARPFAASRRRHKIFSGTLGGILARSFSLNFWPSWDSPRQKFQNTNRITAEEHTHFLLSSVKNNEGSFRASGMLRNQFANERLFLF
jgi:hypothetical protein